MAGYLQVGKIFNTHGLKGEVKIVPLTNDPNRFHDLKIVINVFKNSVDEEVVKNSKKLTIEGIKFFKDKVIAKFEEINSIDEATLLKDSFLVISREDAIKLPAGSYFVCDLMDCEVTDTERGLLGKIIDILQTGSNDVYIVRNDKGVEVLVPVLKTVIKSVDIENKKILVQMPEGL